MSPLKFRAWHKTPCHDDSGSVDFGKCSMTYWEMGSGLDNSWFFKNAIAVMQSTGIKDKNKKEIFERDVVRTYIGFSEGDRKPFIFEIIWSEEDAGWACHPTDSDSDQGMFWLSDFASMWGKDAPNPEEMEVIGNIYENPSLLNP